MEIDKKLLTPHKWPVEEGEVAITTLYPAGYCVVVMEILNDSSALVRYLDSESEDYLMQGVFSLIPTGKTPEDLVEQYEHSPVSLDEALDVERSLPDFSKLKTKKGGGRKKKEVKDLTEEQKSYLKKLLMERWNELKKGD